MKKKQRKKRKPLNQKQKLYIAYALIGISISLMVILIFVLPLGGEPEPVVSEEDIELQPQEILEHAESQGEREQNRVTPEPEEEDLEVTPDNPAELQPQSPAGHIFLVIDDAGYNLDQLQYFLDLQVPLTIAVLPQLGYSEQAAARIQAAGHEAILHLPMEAVSTVNPGPGAVYIDMTAEEIFHTVETNMQSLGIQVAGMNNHMGSKATANANVMNTVLEYIRDNGLFFLDSRTTGDSVINHITQELALPYIKRDVFLDNDTDKEAIHQSFQAGIEIARNEGFVIMIGHVWCQELAEVINEVYPTVEEQGFIFHPLSALYSGTYRNREEGNE